MGTATMKTRLRKPFYLQTANPLSHICKFERRRRPRPLTVRCVQSISRLTSITVFGPYVVFPLISSLVWMAGLLALIAIWVQEGKPSYSRGEVAAVVFISDVGGAHKVCRCRHFLYAYSQG